MYPIRILFMSLLFACSTPIERIENVSTSKDEIQSQYDAVMVVHDSSMAKMGLIQQWRKKCKQCHDAHVADNKFQDCMYRLHSADKLMWDWMHQIVPIDQIGRDTALSYYQKQMIQIQIVSDSINNAITLAQQTCIQ